MLNLSFLGCTKVELWDLRERERLYSFIFQKRNYKNLIVTLYSRPIGGRVCCKLLIKEKKSI